MIACALLVALSQDRLVATLPEGGDVGGITFSSDGSRAPYVLRTADQFSVVVAGTSGPLFKKIHPPVFSADGRHVAYRAQADDGAWKVVVDDHVTEAVDILSDPVFAEGGVKVGYGFRKGHELRWRTFDVH